MPNTVRAKKDGLVTTVIINQPEVKKACKVEAVHKLHSAFQTFDTKPDAKIAMLTGPLALPTVWSSRAKRGTPQSER